MGLIHLRNDSAALLANAAQVSLVSGREAQERHAFLGRQFAEPVVKPYVSERSPAELLDKIIGLHEDAVIKPPRNAWLNWRRDSRI